MFYPKVRFKISKKFDKEIGVYFLNNKIGTYDFGKDRIISEHPVFSKWRKLSEEELWKQVGSYVDRYYIEHQAEIESSLVIMQAIWDAISEQYFQGIEKLFGSVSFYRAKTITAHLSIFRCGVIEDNLRGFQIWYKTESEPDEVRRHIAHEVLHFYYYAYLKKTKHEKLLENWDATEIFNRIILNLPEFKILIGKEELGYSMHTRSLPKYRKLWQSSSNLDEYLSKLGWMEENPMPKSFVVPGQAAFNALLPQKATTTSATGRCGMCSGRCGKSAPRRVKR